MCKEKSHPLCLITKVEVIFSDETQSFSNSRQELFNIFTFIWAYTYPSPWYADYFLLYVSYTERLPFQ